MAVSGGRCRGKGEAAGACPAAGPAVRFGGGGKGSEKGRGRGRDGVREGRGSGKGRGAGGGSAGRGARGARTAPLQPRCEELFAALADFFLPSFPPFFFFFV